MCKKKGKSIQSQGLKSELRDENQNSGVKFPV